MLTIQLNFNLTYLTTLTSDLSKDFKASSALSNAGRTVAKSLSHSYGRKRSLRFQKSFPTSPKKYLKSNFQPQCCQN